MLEGMSLGARDEKSVTRLLLVNHTQLTYMATLSELAINGDLEKIEVELETGEQPWRRLYATPDFIQWLDTVLPDLRTTIFADSEPDEQVDAVFHEYRAGRHLTIDARFKSLSWTPDWSVWEFKTPDLRIFGWVAEKDAFVCTYGDMKDQIETFNRYGRYIAQTKFQRDQLNLNEPKFIASKEYDDVLSDAN